MLENRFRQISSPSGLCWRKGRPEVFSSIKAEPLFSTRPSVVRKSWNCCVFFRLFRQRRRDLFSERRCWWWAICKGCSGPHKRPFVIFVLFPLAAWWTTTILWSRSKKPRGYKKGRKVQNCCADFTLCVESSSLYILRGSILHSEAAFAKNRDQFLSEESALRSKKSRHIFDTFNHLRLLCGRVPFLSLLQSPREKVELFATKKTVFVLQFCKRSKKKWEKNVIKCYKRWKIECFCLTCSFTKYRRPNLPSDGKF